MLEERKLATILFADIVGSTTLAGQHDGVSQGGATWTCRIALLKIHRGAFSAASADLDEVASIIDTSRSRYEQTYRLEALALLARVVGQVGEALQYGTEHLAVAEEIGFPGGIAGGCWSLGVAFLQAADYEGARSALQRSLEVLEPADRGTRPRVLADLARADLGLDQIDAARSRLEEAEATVLPWAAETLLGVRMTAGLVAARLGDSAGAEARFREAIDGIASTQFVAETALARLAFARFLIDRKRTDEARAQLVAARGVFSDPLAFRRRDEIDALLHECELINATG